MGGFGSGRSYSRGRRKRSRKFALGDLPRLVLPDLIKDHKQSQNSHFILSWQDNKFSMNAVFDEEKIHLTGRHGITISMVIRIATFPCHFGGFRYFAHCPACDARVSSLFLYRNSNQTIFACRGCLKMCYQSQNKKLSTRLYWKYYDVKQKINNDPFKKPKWMRKKTFTRLRKEYFDLDEKEQIARMFSLRNNGEVDRIFNRYGCALSAAEAWEMHYFGNYDIAADRLKDMGYDWDCSFKSFPSLNARAS